MTATEQNEARIEAQMHRIVEQSATINRQAQRISDLVLAQDSLVAVVRRYADRMPEFVRVAIEAEIEKAEAAK